MEQMENKAIGERMHPLNEIKVVFLGDGEAGKSHIISRLMTDGGDPMPYVDLSATGIVIRNKEYDLDGRRILVHYWDFGGQEILYSMHRMFITQRTLYVVIVNARDGECDDRAEYWLRCIASYAPDAPVVLVLNKNDQNPNARVDIDRLSQKYGGLKQVLSMSARNMSAELFNKEFTHILLEEIAKSGYLDTQWPVSWMQVRKKLEHMNDYRMTGQAFRRICRECRVEESRDELLRRFNELGISLTFGDEKDIVLHNCIVLRPEWITNALYIIFSNECEFARNGMIPHQSIYDLLSPPPWRTDIRCVIPDVQYTAADMQYVLEVMRKFRMSFQLDEECEFIPAFCRTEPTVDIRYYQRESSILEFHMEFDTLPDSLLYQLLTERYHELDIDNTWRTGAQFTPKKTGTSAVVAIDGNVLLIFVRHTDDGNRANDYLTELKSHVDNIASRMGLEAPVCKILYKQDGKRESFDYEELKIRLNNGESNVFSTLHRKMIPIRDILNKMDPDAFRTTMLLESIINVCKEIPFMPFSNEEELLDAGLIPFLEGYLKTKGIYLYPGRVLAEHRGMSAGALDLFVTDSKDKPLTAIETVRIADGSMRNWDQHLTKLLRESSPHGLSPLFLISFADCDKEKYTELWERFSDHMRRYSPDRSRLLTGSYEEIHIADSGPQYLKIAKCRYFVNGSDVTLYSCFVRVNFSKPEETYEQKPNYDSSEPMEADSAELEIHRPGQLPKETESTKQPEPERRPTQKSLLQNLWNWIQGSPKKPSLPAHAAENAGSSRVLKECRVVFLGDSEAGKSLIMSRVENSKMDPSDFHGNTTIGINIFSRIETITGQLVRVNYWDFGGQEILHSMHRMFLSKRTVYVIVLNTRNDNQDAQADFWLRYVEAYAPGAPVMLVMNKIDQNKRASLNLTALSRQFNRELNNSNVLKISAVEKNSKIFEEQFTDKLIAFLARNPGCIHSFKPLEARIRDEVERKQEKVFKTYDFLSICTRMGIGSEEDQYDLMNRFHDAGILVFFGAKTPMFLNPKWITSLIYKVLDQGEGIAENGVISDIQLSAICEHNPEKWKGAEDSDFLIRIMHDYDLAFTCRKQGSDEKLASAKNLIPMLCQREEPKAIQDLIQKDDPVEMRMVFEYLPCGVLYKLMAEHQKELDAENIWLTGAKFDSENGRYAIVRQEGNTMAIYVHDSSKSGAVNWLIALSEETEYIAENVKFHATLNETKISYRIADVKEYFDYQQLLNTKESGVRLVTSTRKEARSLTEKPPKIPVLDIFDQDEGREKRESEELLQLLLMGCMDVQKDKVFWNVDENARNRQLARTLRGAFTPKDQPQGGTSGSGKGVGELDIEILNEKGVTIAILEALNTTSINTSNWRDHLDKLMDNYNTSGLRYLILTSYVKCPKKNFERKFGETANHWKSIEPRGFEGCLEAVSRIMEDVCPELIRVTRAVYSRNNFKVLLYHFVVHIGGDEEDPSLA